MPLGAVEEAAGNIVIKARDEYRHRIFVKGCYAWHLDFTEADVGTESIKIGVKSQMRKRRERMTDVSTKPTLVGFCSYMAIQTLRCYSHMNWGVRGWRNGCWLERWCCRDQDTFQRASLRDEQFGSVQLWWRPYCWSWNLVLEIGVCWQRLGIIFEHVGEQVIFLLF